MDGASPKADGPVSLSRGLREVWALLTPRLRRQLALCAVLMVLSAFAELVTIGSLVPLLALLVSDGAGSGWLGWLPLGLFGADPLRAALLMLCAAAIAAAMLRLLAMSRVQETAIRIGEHLGSLLFSRIVRQPYEAHLRRDPAEVLASAQKVKIVTGAVILPLMNAVVGIVIALPAIVLLLAVEPVGVGIAAAVLGAGYALFGRAVRRRLEDSSRTVAAATTARMTLLQQAIGGIRDILLNNLQAAYEARYRASERAAGRAQAALMFIVQAPRQVLEAAAIVLVGAYAFYASGQPGGMAAAVPVLGALALGAQRLLPLLQQVHNGWGHARGNLHALDDVLRLLDGPEPELPAATAEPLPFRHEIRFDRVSLDHPGGRSALRDVSLAIPHGARVGLIGPSGCGKSSLIDVLTGLLTPTAGQVSVDGVLLEGEARRGWQATLAVVPQDIYLADVSIGENIAFGEAPDNADPQRTAEAARLAALDGFIATLPEGYETRVGERGITLSGGQRQRIAIARALYRRADVLLFDEATSSLDAATEAEIARMIAALPREVTVIIASHRAAPLELCDLIVHMECGEVVRVERHDVSDAA